LLFSTGSSCIALQLQICPVSSSPNKVGQFSFQYGPLSHETSSGIHHCGFGRLLCHPTVAFSICSLRVWLRAPPLSSRAGLAFHLTSAVSARLQFTAYAFQFCWWGGFNLPRGCAGLCSCSWYMLLTCSFCRFTQAALEPANGGEMVCHFSQHSGVGKLSMG
jgi:hypothetical protein